MTANFRYWHTKKDHPYPMSALRQIPCIRCGKPGHGQWKTCADGQFRVVCGKCDAQLNALILYFMKHPKMKILLHQYQAKLVNELESHILELEAQLTALSPTKEN